jgi:hypothetical protein
VKDHGIKAAARIIHCAKVPRTQTRTKSLNLFKLATICYTLKPKEILHEIAAQGSDPGIRLFVVRVWQSVARFGVHVYRLAALLKFLIKATQVHTHTPQPLVP